MNRLNKIPFLKDLRHFQKIGARMIDRMGGRCILADPMGVGKTWQAIAYLAMYPEERPAIVVMPASVKLKWADEFKKLLPNEHVQIASGRKAFNFAEGVLLINYDIIHYSIMVDNPKYDPSNPKSKKKIKIVKAREEILNNNFKIVIGDEIHKIANYKAGRTIAFTALCKHKKKILVLSGTPVKDKPIKFYPILKIIDPQRFGNWFDFIMTYCGGKKEWFGWYTDGATNLDQLHEKLSTIMIRRNKVDILPELPPKMRSIIPLEIDNRKTYDRAKNEYIRWLKANDKNMSETALAAQTLTQMGVLRKLAVDGVLQQAVAWIDDYLESGNKLVVGCEHRAINDYIFSYFKKKAVQFIGGMNITKKHTANKRFQEDDKIRLAICNIEAAAEGIDLYAAPATCTIEFTHNPDMHDQFEARVDRIGQTSDTVMAYYLVGVNTIMEDMAKTLDSKKLVIDAIVDGRAVNKSELFTELIKRSLEK